jgi:type IV secretion system protein VirB1
MDVMNCQYLAVPLAVMQHVVNVESSFNPYAIGVVGGHLQRQPANLSEALSTVRMLESRGYNFSLGLAQVNRYNLAKYGLFSYAQAFQACPNLRAGARILADCHARSGNDWGRSFSCYYSGDFVTGFRQGYVQKVFASARSASRVADGRFPGAIAVLDGARRRRDAAPKPNASTLSRRIDAAPPAFAGRAPPTNTQMTSVQAHSIELAASDSSSPVGSSGAGGSPAVPASAVDQAFVF